MVDDVEDLDFEIDAKSLRAFFGSLTLGKQLALTSAEDLKLCASHISVVFSQLFTWSLKENTIPFTWKTSVICPVKQQQQPKLFLFKYLSSDCSDIYCNEGV